MLTHLRAFADLYSVPINDRALAQAQVKEMARRMPLVYLITCISAAGLSFTHYDVAPVWLTLALPLVLVLACIARLRYWLMDKGRIYTHRAAIARLRASVRLGSVLGFAFVIWCLSLYPYGDAVLHTYIAFFIVVTVVGVVCCLLYLRAAALAVATSVLVPFFGHYLLTQEAVHFAMAVNTIVVVSAVVYVMLTYYNDFSQLISSNVKTAKLSDENLKLANHDSLTGLPNRRVFFDVLKRWVEGEQNHTPVTVGLLDIDGFKPINDVYGHIVGDQLLMEIGRRLCDFTSDRLTVARLGGDEFGFLATPALSDEDAHALGEKIGKAIADPIQLAASCVRVTASIGIISGGGDSAEANQLFEKADHALYFAKQNQRGRIVMFSEEHENAIRQRSFVETELKNADLDKELTLAFQPIYDQETGRISAVEALARWSRDGVQFTPDVFIRQAERCGIMGKLTSVLLRKALRAARAWPSDVGLSFNLSAADIGSHKTMAHITDLVLRSRFPAERITFEITETSIVQDFGRAEAALSKLKELGSNIAMDDFGTGFSSLSYLQRLPFDRVKLDRSFVSEIENDDKTRRIVRSIVRLAHELDISVVAEGIETEGQRRLLLDMDCQLLQGFLLSRPITGADLLKHFRGSTLDAALALDAPKSATTINT